MTGKKLVVGIIAALIGLSLIYGTGGKLRYPQRVEQLTDKPRTVCLGRFLIDVPQLMEVSYSHTFIGGFWVSSVNESAEAFQAKIRARETQITSALNELGKPNMERVQDVSAHGFIGKIFTFGRTSVEGMENHQTVYYVNVAMEGYVHSKNTTFSLTASAVDPELTGRLAQIIDRLRVVEPPQVPAEPGFCFGSGMLIDPVPLDWTEGVAMFAGYTEEPDLALAFHTRAGLPNEGLGRLARTAKADAELPLWQKPLFRKIRMGQRNINGITGEEVLEQCTELNATHTYAFDWEFGGKKDDALRPAMHLEMSTGHPASPGTPTKDSFLNEEQLIRLWDQISGSIRVRPTQAAKPEGVLSVSDGPKLGQSVFSGNVCPASGWWRCQERSAVDGVRWFAKGEVFPAATLEVVRPTTWFRRPVVDIFQRQTAWSLVSQASKHNPPPDHSR